MWPFLLCVVPWVICFIFGVYRFWTFFLVISICTELLWFGRGIGITCSLINCFWNIWVALKRASWSKTHSDWMATEEAAAVEAVL